MRTVTAKYHIGMQARFRVLYALFAREEASNGRPTNKRAFAEALGATDSKLSNWFNGQRPAVDMGISIAERFGVDLDWLYRGRTAGIPMVRTREIEDIARTMNLEDAIKDL